MDHGYRSIDIDNYMSLCRLKHLNAVIHEALRLYPVLLTGAPRKTGPNGLTIADTFIPPETTIVSPRYIIQRSAYILQLSLLMSLSCSNAHTQPPPQGLTASLSRIDSFLSVGLRAATSC